MSFSPNSLKRHKSTQHLSRLCGINNLYGINNLCGNNMNIFSKNKTNVEWNQFVDIESGELINDYDNEYDNDKNKNTNYYIKYIFNTLKCYTSKYIYNPNLIYLILLYFYLN